MTRPEVDESSGETTDQLRWRYSLQAAGLQILVKTRPTWELRVRVRGPWWFVATSTVAAVTVASTALRAVLEIADSVERRSWYLLALTGVGAVAAALLAAAAYYWVAELGDRSGPRDDEDDA